MTEPLISVRHLTRDFEITRGLSHKKIGTIRAVNDVSFSIQRGEILGMVGESGCGKTTAGRCVLRAIEPTAGEVWIRLVETEEAQNLLQFTPRQLQTVRKDMRLIFQDPYSSLNPRMTIKDILSEVLVTNGLTRSKSDTYYQVATILEKVGLSEDHMSLYPHAFSGGQRQRIAIARALISKPKFIVADEPVSALDVSIQAQILNLLLQLKSEMNLTFLFIAHNLAVIGHACDRIAVMYLGEIVEMADAAAVINSPCHPYSEALISAVPEPDPRIRKKRIPLRGEIGDFLNLPSGCVFHPRCPYVLDICRTQKPELHNINIKEDKEHWVACHFAGSLNLAGIGQ